MKIVFARYLLLVLAACGLGGAWAQQCPTIGVLRWDAWDGDDSEAGRQVQLTLGEKPWHGRVPFCGQVTASGGVKINCDSQEAMDQEIAYAARAGIDYFIFEATNPDNPRAYGMKLYRASRNKGLVRFAVRSALGNWGSPSDYQSRVKRFVEAMKDPAYQKVDGERPLFFVSFIRKKQLQEWGRDGFRRAIDDLRAQAQAAGLKNPYIVVMDNTPDRGKGYLDAFGFDALSTYATHGRDDAGKPYAALAGHAKQFWERARQTGAHVVPIVMAGWDNRPRAAHPARYQMDRLENLGRAYYTPATPEELAAHFEEALRWVEQHPRITEARTVVSYAWNEHDEGGWIEPTLGEGTARIDALGAMVRRTCPAKQRPGASGTR